MSTPEDRWTRAVSFVLAVYWLALFAGTHSPIDPNLVLPGDDKTKHFLGYSGLAFLFGFFLTLRRRRSRSSGARRFPFVGAALLLALYGAFDELTQPLVGRTTDRYDWLADAAGILVGLTLIVSLSAMVRLPGDCRRAPD